MGVRLQPPQDQHSGKPVQDDEQRERGDVQRHRTQDGIHDIEGEVEYNRHQQAGAGMVEDPGEEECQGQQQKIGRQVKAAKLVVGVTQQEDDGYNERSSRANQEGSNRRLA